MSFRRLALASIVLACAACRDSPPPVPDRIEIRVSGWSAVDIAVDRAGLGSYRLSDRPSDDQRGSFSMSPKQLHQLLRRLEPYRKQAEPATDESSTAFIERSCARGVPFATDSGAVYIRWVGPKSDLHFLADLGCDYERHASRNKELLGLVSGLPVPLDW